MDADIASMLNDTRAVYRFPASDSVFMFTAMMAIISRNVVMISPAMNSVTPNATDT